MRKLLLLSLLALVSAAASAQLIEYKGVYYNINPNTGIGKIVKPTSEYVYSGDVEVYTKIEHEGKTYPIDINTGVLIFQNSKISNLICGFNPEDTNRGYYSLSLRYDSDLESIKFLYTQNYSYENHWFNNVNLGESNNCVDIDLVRTEEGSLLKINKFNIYGPDGSRLKPRLLIELTGEMIAPDANNTFHLDADLTYEGNSCGVVELTNYTVALIYCEASDGKFASIRREIGENSGVGDITAESDLPATYYNLQGLEVDADRLRPGVYLRKQGSACTKVFIRK